MGCGLGILGFIASLIAELYICGWHTFLVVAGTIAKETCNFPGAAREAKALYGLGRALYICDLTLKHGVFNAGGSGGESQRSRCLGTLQCFQCDGHGCGTAIVVGTIHVPTAIDGEGKNQIEQIIVTFYSLLFHLNLYRAGHPNLRERYRAREHYKIKNG